MKTPSYLKDMKRIHIIIYIALLLCPLTLRAQWTFHSSYQTLTDAVECGPQIVGLYEGGSILSYDKESEEVRFLNRSTGLSGTVVKFVDWCRGLKTLVVVYEDGNIDLLRLPAEEVTNLPQLQQSPEGAPLINALWTGEREALISTGEGVILLNVAEASIKGYYRIGAIKEARIHEGTIYAWKADGSIVKCALTANPLDASSWTAGGSKLPGTSRDNKNALATLKNNLAPYGPASSYHYALRWDAGRLLSVAGRVDATDLVHTPPTIMTYNGRDWQQFSTDFSKDPEPLPFNQYFNPSDAITDPADTSHVFVSYGSVGLAEYKSGKLTTRHGVKNSPLVCLVPGRSDYIRLSALAFDAENNLWMANDGTDTVLVCRKADGTWKKHYFAALKGSTEVEHIAFDQEGRLWLADKRYAGAHRGGIFCYDPATRKSQFRSSFTNEDGTSYTIGSCYTLVVDLNNQVWVGTDEGLFVVDNPADYLSDDFLMLQIKVPRNDGTNYADYLLSGVAITAIAVDGANRKWIGTADNGLYLVSADGIETLHHFTTENSPLPSNYIYSLAIDPATGEVYVGTQGGLVSYAGTATEPLPSLQKSNLHIYPNPLRPEHPRLITIQGLTQNAEVKIATLAGQVVNCGRSLGGAYQWDATDFQGRPCASGVYLVLVSAEEGKTSIAGRLAIVR